MDTARDQPLPFPERFHAFHGPTRRARRRSLAPRPSHLQPSLPTTVSAALATAAIQPLHVFAWIVDSGLRDSLKALSHAILRRVDRHTWRWPRRHGALGGVTVEDLADGAGLSRRHAARCLRALEDLGLVRTTFRPFEVSEYELVHLEWRAMADRHRSDRQARKDATRADRIQRFNDRRTAALARRAERAADPPKAAPKAPPQRTTPAPTVPTVPTPAADPPRWAWRHAQRLDSRPETVFGLVGGAAAAILGPDVDPRAQGGLARPVLRLWGDRGRPDPDQLIAELDLVARWAQQAVHPDAVTLRGAGRVPGPNRSRDARALCTPADFEQRLGLARGHDHAQANVAAPPAPTPAAPPALSIPTLGKPPWIPPGQPSFLPGLGPPPDALDRAWRTALDHLRRDESQDRGAIDIFLSPLRPVEVRDGAVVLAAPSADSARWVGTHLTEALAVIAESFGAPVGLVVSTA